MEEETDLKPGDIAPEFSAASSDGNNVSLKQFRGKWVILYFYPRDNTPGCTRQACSFRDNHHQFDDLNAVILGCSGDSLKSHEGFIQKFGLPFALLSDPEHTVARAFGVWQEKVLYGKRSMGIVRTTFLIDPEGKVAKIWRRVKVDGHIEKVLETLQDLQGN